MSQNDDSQTDSHRSKVDNSWKIAQRNTFTKWLNAQLRSNGHPPDVKDITADLCDGVILARVTAGLTGEEVKVKEKPRGKFAMLVNVDKSLTVLRRYGTPLVNIGAGDVVSRNEKLVLALIWALIQGFQITDIVVDGSCSSSDNDSVAQEERYRRKKKTRRAAQRSSGIQSDDESSASEEISPKYTPKPTMRRRMSIRELQSQGKSTKEALLEILNKKLKPYNIIVKNLSSDWVDGKALAALIQSQMPAFNMEVEESDSGSLLRRCISTAETHLNIPAFVDAADVEAGVLDDVCMMTYLSNFFKNKVTRGPSLEIVDEEASKSDKSEEDSLGEETSSLLHTTSNLDQEPIVDMGAKTIELLDDNIQIDRNCEKSSLTSSASSTSSTSPLSSSSSSLIFSQPINKQSKEENFDRSGSNSSEEKQSKSSGLFFSPSESRSTSQSPETSATPRTKSGSGDNSQDTKATSPDLDTSLQFSEALPTNSLFDLRSLPEESSKSEYPLFSLRRPGLMYTPEALALLDCGKGGGFSIPDTDSEHHDVTSRVIDTERQIKDSGSINEESSENEDKVPAQDISLTEEVVSGSKVDETYSNSTSQTDDQALKMGKKEDSDDDSFQNKNFLPKDFSENVSCKDLGSDKRNNGCSDTTSAHSSHNGELCSNTSSATSSKQAECPQNVTNDNGKIELGKEDTAKPLQCTAGLEKQVTEKTLFEDNGKFTKDYTSQDCEPNGPDKEVNDSEKFPKNDHSPSSLGSKEADVIKNGTLESVQHENTSDSQSIDSNQAINSNSNKSSSQITNSGASFQEESLNKNDTSSESSKRTDQISDRLLDKTWSITCGDESSFNRSAGKNMLNIKPFAGKYTSYHDLRNVGRGDKRLSLPEFFLNKSRQHLAPSTASLNRTSYYSTDVFEHHFISENPLECEFLESNCQFDTDTKSSSDTAYNDSNTSDNVGSIFGLDTDKSIPPIKPPRSRVASESNNKRSSTTGIEMLLNEVARKFNLPSDTEFIMSDCGNVDQLRKKQQIQTPNKMVKNSNSLPDLALTSEVLGPELSEQCGLEYDMFDPRFSVSGFEVAKTETLPTSFELDEITNINERVTESTLLKRDGSGEVENINSAKSPSNDNRSMFIGGCLEDQIGEKSASRTSVRFDLSNLGIDSNVGSSQDTSFESSQGENRDFLFGFIESSESENSETLLQEINGLVSKQNIVANDWTSSWVDGKVLLALVDSKIPGIYQRHKHSSSYIALSEALEVVKKHLKITPALNPSKILLQDFNHEDLMDLARNVLRTNRFQHISNVEKAESREAVQVNTLIGKLGDQDEKNSYLRQLNLVLARRGLTVGDLSSEWSDGKVLLSLVDRFVSGVQGDGEHLPTKEKVLFGLKMADSYLNIKPIVSAEELVHGHFPDHVAAYLLQFRSLCEEVTGPAVKRRPKKNPPLPPRTKHRNSKAFENCAVGSGNRSGRVGSTDYEHMTRSVNAEISQPAVKGMTLSNPDEATGLTESEAQLLMEKLLKQFHQFLVKQDSDSTPKDLTITPEMVSNFYENFTNNTLDLPAKEALYSVNDKTIFISCDIPHSTINKVLRTLYDRFDGTTTTDFSGPMCFKADKYCFCNEPVIAPKDGAAVLKMTVMSDCECDHIKIKPILTVGRDRLVHDRFRSSFVLLTDFEGGTSGTSSDSSSGKEHYCRMKDETSHPHAVISERSKSRFSSLISKIKKPFRKKKVKRLNQRSITSESSSITTELKKKTNNNKSKRVDEKRKQVNFSKGQKRKTTRSTQTPFEETTWNNTTAHVEPILTEPEISLSGENHPGHNPASTSDSGRVLYQNCTFNTYSCCRECKKHSPNTTTTDHSLLSPGMRVQFPYLAEKHEVLSLSRPGTPGPGWEYDLGRTPPTRSHHHCYNRFCSRSPSLYKTEQVDTIYHGISSLPHDNFHLGGDSSDAPIVFSKTENLVSTPFSSSDDEESEVDKDDRSIVSTEDEEKDFSTEKEVSSNSLPHTPSTTKHSTTKHSPDLTTKHSPHSTTKRSPDFSTIENLVDEVVYRVESYNKSSTELEPDISSLRHVVEIVLEPDLATQLKQRPSALCSHSISKNPHGHHASGQKVRPAESQITPSYSLSGSGSTELFTKTLSMTETQYSIADPCNHHQRKKSNAAKNKNNAVKCNHNSARSSHKTASSSACTLLASTRSTAFAGFGVNTRRHVTSYCDSAGRSTAKSSLMDSNIFSTLLKEKKKTSNRKSCQRRCEKCNRPKKVRIASSRL
ncbi:hypothetical protein ACHWQZ_G000694 [Mnemiopsis leidyi]